MKYLHSKNSNLCKQKNEDGMTPYTQTLYILKYCLGVDLELFLNCFQTLINLELPTSYTEELFIPSDKCILCDDRKAVLCVFPCRCVIYCKECFMGYFRYRPYLFSENGTPREICSHCQKEVECVLDVSRKLGMKSVENRMDLLSFLDVFKQDLDSEKI